MIVMSLFEPLLNLPLLLCLVPILYIITSHMTNYHLHTNPLSLMFMSPMILIHTVKLLNMIIGSKPWKKNLMLRRKIILRSLLLYLQEPNQSVVNGHIRWNSNLMDLLLNIRPCWWLKGILKELILIFRRLLILLLRIPQSELS